MHSNLQRFLEAQNQTYLKALEEISNGQKQSHWMWFIFPQIRGLGKSENARFFGIADIDEATAYHEHPVLGKHLIEISQKLLQHRHHTASQIFGSPDDMKLRSSMTLFASVPQANPIFEQVLSIFFDGKPDEKTLKILEQQKTGEAQTNLNQA